MAHALDLPHDPQEVASQNLLQILLAISAPGQFAHQVRKLRDILHANGGRINAVEIRAQADVVDPAHLHRVVNVIGDRGVTRRRQVLQHGLLDLHLFEIGQPLSLARVARSRRGKLRPQMMLLESLAQASFARLRQANRRHDLVAVQIADRYELELPALGRLVLNDAETGEVVEINTGDERKRAAFAERQARAQVDLTRLFRSAGIDAIRLRTDQPYAAELGKFFETREKRRLRG